MGDPTPMPTVDKPEWFQMELVSQLGRTFRSILKNLHLFQSYQATAARHHVIQRRQESIDLVLAIDNLDHQGQVFRKTQYLRRVKPAGCAKTHRTAQNGRAGQVLFARLQNDCLVQWRSAEFVVLANENTQQ